MKDLEVNEVTGDMSMSMLLLLLERRRRYQKEHNVRSDLRMFAVVICKLQAAS